MTAKHTPGPWEWGRDMGSFWIETEKDGYSVASVNNHNITPQNEANAHLIAAAPEMLASLEAMVESYEHEASARNPTLLQARAVIAKAPGDA